MDDPEQAPQTATLAGAYWLDAPLHHPGLCAWCDRLTHFRDEPAPAPDTHPANNIQPFMAIPGLSAPQGMTPHHPQC